MRVPDYSNARFDGDRPASEAPDDDVVADCFICPGCGENRVDWLAWDEDGTVVKIGRASCRERVLFEV